MTQPGKLIALEGIDGAGTTTQVPRVAAYLRDRGHSVITTFEPSSGAVGQLCRQALSASVPPPPHAMALLFIADRYTHDAEVVGPALAQGQMVVCDRHILSTLAYQGIFLPLPWLLTLSAASRRPDLSILLQISPRLAAKRRAGRASKPEMYEKDVFLRRVAAAYTALAHKTEYAGPVVQVAAHKPPDEVTADIGLLLERHLFSNRHQS